MRRLKLENFYVHSSLFALLSLGGAVANYALYPALTRVLNTSSFGDFTAILALSNQITGILLAFNLTSIYLVKKFPEAEALEKAQTIQKVLIWLFVGATFLLLVFSPFVKSYLHIEDQVSFIILALLLISSIPAIMWTGYLQGHKQLVKVGIFTFVASAVKFVLAVTLAASAGVRGGLWGVLAGTILGLVVLRLVAGVRLPSIRTVFTALPKSQRIFIHGMRLYILESFLVVGMLSVLQNVDILYAKALFVPSQAGVYVGISILSNAIYYIAFLLIWILLPEVSIDKPAENSRVLRTAYKFLGALAVGVVLTELVTGSLLAKVLLGSAFDGQGSVLIVASIFQLLLIAITLYAYYLLVLRKRKALLLSGCIFIPVVIAPRLFVPHSPLTMIVTILISALCGLITYCIINVLRGQFRHGTTQTTN